MSSMMIVLVVILGLVFGSFTNAVVWRLHEQANRRSRKGKRARADNLSIVTGSSQCTRCGHELSALDLIPVASYLFLRGRCRYCHKPIEDTPVAELLAPLAFVASYLWWPYDLSAPGVTLARITFGLWLLFLVGFVILALYDLKWFLLPDRVVFPLIGLASIQVLIAALWFHQGWPGLLAAFWGVVCIAGLFYLLHVISKGSWIGFGDVKLGVVLGLLVGGPLPALLLIFLASFLGSIAAIPLLARGKAVGKTRVPFGPFLLLATIIVMLFGGHIIGWYLGLLSPTAHL